MTLEADHCCGRLSFDVAPDCFGAKWNQLCVLNGSAFVSLSDFISYSDR